LRIAADAGPAQLDIVRSTVWSRLRSREIYGVSAAIGLSRLPLVFVDTGAQYTILSATAARAAGVMTAGHGSPLVGFAKFSATPGLIPELRLGDLVIHDVPVFVGESPALARARGQMAIGNDLLEHLRVTLDLATDRATVEPAAGAASLGEFDSAKGWQARLWSFPQTCLAEAYIGDDRYARVLIDTGNWEGTFVSRRWAERQGIDIRAASNPLLRYFDLHARSRVGLELGGQTFDDHPLSGPLPAALDRLNLFDMIVGHDVLDRQRVTIDLTAGLLRCERTSP
jgi:hypothetical protein